MTYRSMVPNVGPTVAGLSQPVLWANCFVPNNCVMVPNLIAIATTTTSGGTLFQYNSTTQTQYIPLLAGFA